jgi:DNA-directed RNA polymerase specialized sigma24 family protein
MKVKRHKIERVRDEFARLGRVCDVVAVTGYSRTLVSAVVNGRAEVSALELKENVAVHNSYDMDNLPAQEQINMENFGELQYIIDRLPKIERFVLRQYFVHGWTKTRIAEWFGKSTRVVDRILRNLRKIDLTGDEPIIMFRGKTFPLESLNGCSQTA